MDDKQQTNEKPISTANEKAQENEQVIWDMKQELQDYIEEQGIYIRQ